MIDLERARQLVREALERTPDRINPHEVRDSGYYKRTVCLYTDPTDGTLHCIAGQVLADAGITPPAPGAIAGFDSMWSTGFDDVSDYYPPLFDKFSQEAAEFLTRVQRVADGEGWDEEILPPNVVGDFKTFPRKWGEVLSILDRINWDFPVGAFDIEV